MKINKNLNNLEPYNQITSSKISSNDSDIYKLDWNESTQDIPEILKKIFVNKIIEVGFNYYPDLKASELKNKLEQYTGFSKDYISVYNGSDSALDIVCRTFLNINDSVAMIEPTYSNFKTFIQKNGGIYYGITSPDPFVIDLAYIEKKINIINPKIVYIVNPNNPTGTYLGKKEVESLLKKHPDKLFVIDEAYYEFIQKTTISLQKNYDNILISRTFSKAFSLAGLRLGYIIANPKITSYLKLVKNDKEVNVLAQIMGAIALENIDYMIKYVKEVHDSKKIFKSFFEDIGFKVSCLYGNFFLVKVNKPKEFVKYLSDNNIFIRDRSDLPNLNNYVRFTAGDVETTKNVISELKKINILSYIY